MFALATRCCRGFLATPRDVPLTTNSRQREALTYGGDRPVPHEDRRMPEAQVTEVRERQAERLLPADLDRVSCAWPPRPLSDIPDCCRRSRMVTGMTPDDPRFMAGWEALLRWVGNALEVAARRRRNDVAADQ
jgi:hypothetical protein